MLLLRLLKLFHIKSHKQPKKTVSGRHRKYCPVDKTGWKLFSSYQWLTDSGKDLSKGPPRDLSGGI